VSDALQCAGRLVSRAQAPSGMLPDVRTSSNSIAAVAACLVVAAGLFANAAGCGSGGGSIANDGGGGASGSGTLTWQDDGAAHQALFASATLVTSTGLQILQVAGGESGGIGIAFGISAKPAVALGDFQCGPGANAGYPITSFSYTADGVAPLYQSCTVSVATLGAASGERVTGTFSAVLTKTAGGTKAITAGVFNLTLTVSP
jgi:hypothetical protein